MHPLAMFQILEAWNNRPVDSTDVIGVLLGTKSDTTVSLQEAYYLHHSIKQEPSLQIQCDLAFANVVQSVSTALHPDYEILGWFTTYTQLNEVHRVIHTHFSQHFDIPNLALLTVDVTLDKNSLQPTLYTHVNSSVLVENPAAVAAAASSSTTTTTTTTTTNDDEAQEDEFISSPQTALTRFVEQTLKSVIPTQEKLALHGMVFGAGDVAEGCTALRANIDSVRTLLLQKIGANLDKALANLDACGDDQIKALLQLVTNTPVLDDVTSKQIFQPSMDDLQLFTNLALLTQQIVNPATEEKA